MYKNFLALSLSWVKDKLSPWHQKWSYIFDSLIITALLFFTTLAISRMNNCLLPWGATWSNINPHVLSYYKCMLWIHVVSDIVEKYDIYFMMIPDVDTILHTWQTLQYAWMLHSQHHKGIRSPFFLLRNVFYNITCLWLCLYDGYQLI